MLLGSRYAAMRVLFCQEFIFLGVVVTSLAANKIPAPRALAASLFAGCTKEHATEWWWWREPGMGCYRTAGIYLFGMSRSFGRSLSWQGVGSADWRVQDALCSPRVGIDSAARPKLRGVCAYPQSLAQICGTA